MTTIKKQLTDILISLGYPAEKVHLEYPTEASFGDYATNLAMVMAKEKKQPPFDLAQEIKKQLEANKVFYNLVEKVEVVKPGFINFFVKDDYLVTLPSNIYNTDLSLPSNHKKVVIEYASPNTNKPIHLGHLRNNFIGMALGNLFKHNGYDVVLTEIVNDRGIHICKSMLAYQLWGKGDTPEQSGLKSDHFVAKYYVMFSKKEKNDPTLMERAQELLRKWEAGDEEVRSLWKQMNTWAESGFRQTYEVVGSRFDMHEYESDIYDKGKQIVLNALAEGKAMTIEGGAVAVDLSEYNLGGREGDRKVLLRSDGTTMYMTQDLYLAIKRWEEHKPEKMFYVVANEQNYHFKVLFKILEIFGYEWVKDRYVHAAYGMVNLPEGKMKSREGTVVDADTLIEELTAMAREEVTKRQTDLSETEVTHRSGTIALAALKFHILKVDPKSTMIYDPKASLDFEGDTGPYILYTYARLRSILQKSNTSISSEAVEYSLNDAERAIAIQLNYFSELIPTVLDDIKIHHLAEYLLKLSSLVNSWYAHNSVLLAEDEKQKQWRLQMIASVTGVLKEGLSLLGIDTLEQM